MLQQRRDQGHLINSLIRVVDDEEALRLVVERNRKLIDEEFFGLLAQTFEIYAAQGQQQVLEPLDKLRRFLVDNTEIGSEIKKQEQRIQHYLSRLKPEMQQTELLDLLIDAWQDEDGETMTGIMVSAVLPMIDYQFLMVLAQRIDAASDPGEAENLKELREFLLRLQEEQRQNNEAMMQRVQALLQEVLQAPDTDAALRKRANQIDEVFLNVLAANMRQAQQNKATAAANRLRQVYEQALAIFEERMPEDMRLLNQLLRAPDDAASRKLLQENRELLTKEFVESIKTLEEHARNDGSAQLANRLKSLRGQVALMR
jgi:uncharacterized protein YmfQ (DUF2313 family)